jgi:hypothetical protein
MPFAYFALMYEKLKQTQTDDDYLAVLRMLAPTETKFSALVNNKRSI